MTWPMGTRLRPMFSSELPFRGRLANVRRSQLVLHVAIWKGGNYSLHHGMPSLQSFRGPPNSCVDILDTATRLVMAGGMLILLSSPSRSATISKSSLALWPDRPTQSHSRLESKLEDTGRSGDEQSDDDLGRPSLGKSADPMVLRYSMWEACPGLDSSATDRSALYGQYSEQQAPASSPSRGSPCPVPTTRRQDSARPLCTQGRYWCHVAAGLVTPMGPSSSRPSADSDRLWGGCHGT